MPKAIGLTGRIASGKSTVSEPLSIFGFKVADADKAAREAVKKGSKGLAQVREVFDDEAIDENGEMSRHYVDDLVFNHPEKCLELNAIIHPIVRDIMEEKKQEYLKQGYNIIMDIPLLFESELEDTVDEVWVVYTSEGIQMDRLVQRSDLSLEDVRARVYSQISIGKKGRMTDRVIDSLGDRLELKQNLGRSLEREGYIGRPNYGEED